MGRSSKNAVFKQLFDEYASYLIMCSELVAYSLLYREVWCSLKSLLSNIWGNIKDNRCGIVAQSHETSSALHAAGSVSSHALSFKEKHEKEVCALKKDPVFTHLHLCSECVLVTAVA